MTKSTIVLPQTGFPADQPKEPLLEREVIARAIPPELIAGLYFEVGADEVAQRESVYALSGAAERSRMGGLFQTPFDGPRQVLEYLGRFTHRAAPANQRLLDAKDGQVTFQ